MAREPSEAELDALMARLVDGDRAAFDPLFRALYPRALRLAGRRLGGVDASGADEVAQRTLMKVFSNAGAFASGRPVVPWFYALLANELRAFERALRRDARRSLDAPPLETIEDSVLDVETALLDRELARALELAIDALDAPAAQAIHALLGRGPAPAVEPAAFRKRVSRAYARLRLLLLGERDAR